MLHMVVKEYNFLDQQQLDGLDGNPPVETNIELNFQEIEIITRERIELGY